MGLFPLFPSRLTGSLKGLQDGCLQVHDRDVPQEAERCYALPAEDQVLALPSAHKGPSCTKVNSARQGQEAGIQEQARFRHLPYCYASWWPSKNKSQRGTCNPLLRSASAVDSRVFVC